MSGYALKILNAAKASLAAHIGDNEKQIQSIQTEIDDLHKDIDDSNSTIGELDAAIALLTPPAEPGEAQPA